MMKKLYIRYQTENLKIFLEEGGGKIASVKITGDFYVSRREYRKDRALSYGQNSMKYRSVRDLKCAKQYPTKLFGLDHASLISTIITAYHS